MDNNINDVMIEAYDKLAKYSNELEDRINKALDYIEVIQYNETYGVKEKDYLEIIDILKGE